MKDGTGWKSATIVGAVALIAAAYGLGRETANTAAKVDKSEEAIAFICSTTSVLDDLVVAAADQIQLNLDNGTYAKLIHRGIVTKASLRAARDTMHNYQAAHRSLVRGVEKCPTSDG